MKVARYFGAGAVRIVDEPIPALPTGGLLVKTIASGLCSGELMDWYMDGKIPHVLGHEVTGRIVESDDSRFPVGALVTPHHHASCLSCEQCRLGRFVECPQWKRTRLAPGGMAEYFAVAAENLTDAHLTDDLAPADSALAEPLACVAKAVSRYGRTSQSAVVGLGAMGLLHMAVLGQLSQSDGSPPPFAIETSESRRVFAYGGGFDARTGADKESADVVYVCPGGPGAFAAGLELVAPEGTVVVFAPSGPGQPTELNVDSIYFKNVAVGCSYSAGPPDMTKALEWIRIGWVGASQVVSDFIEIDQLPQAYLDMKAGRIVKPMVMFE